MRCPRSARLAPALPSTPPHGPDAGPRVPYIQDLGRRNPADARWTAGIGFAVSRGRLAEPWPTRTYDFPARNATRGGIVAKHKRSSDHGSGTKDSRKKAGSEQLKRKDYERKLRKLHGELVRLQQWAQHKGLKVCIVFEGRDGAGKGGTIKAITERVSPRVFRVVALPAPTEREKTQMYAQRYLAHLPAAGEVVIFDRSWCNRAGVEGVMGL